VSLLADSPVDALAQEVRVAHVPRILLDHVHQRFAHRDAVLLDRAIETPRYGRRRSDTAGVRPGRPGPGGTINARRRPDAAPGRAATGRTAASAGPPWQPRPTLRTLAPASGGNRAGTAPGCSVHRPAGPCSRGSDSRVPANMFDQPKVLSGSCSVMTRKYRLERDVCASGFCRLPRGHPAGPGEVDQGQSGEQEAVGDQGAQARRSGRCGRAQAARPTGRCAGRTAGTPVRTRIRGFGHRGQPRPVLACPPERTGQRSGSAAPTYAPDRCAGHELVATMTR
jgi:hypothetical protein